MNHKLATWAAICLATGDPTTLAAASHTFGTRLPRRPHQPPHEMTDQDHANLTTAQAKRERRALKLKGKT